MMEYRHGGDVYRNEKIRYDYSININPLGMPDFIRDAAIRGIEESSRYPDSRCGQLRELAANFYGVKNTQLIFGNGAAELIFAVCRALSPKKAVLPAPTFTEYERALHSSGAQCSFFSLPKEQSFILPVDEYLQFLQYEKPDMIFLCNPSNPVGNLIPAEDIRRILAYCRDRNIFAVIDECFLELTGREKEASAVCLIREGYENLMVLQACTKSFAMAGLRLGYGFFADPSMIDAMERSLQPWNVSIPAQKAGCAAFGPKRSEYLTRSAKYIENERGYLWQVLKDCGFQVYPSSAKT